MTPNELRRSKDLRTFPRSASVRVRRDLAKSQPLYRFGGVEPAITGMDTREGIPVMRLLGMSTMLHAAMAKIQSR